LVCFDVDAVDASVGSTWLVPMFKSIERLVLAPDAVTVGVVADCVAAPGSVPVIEAAAS